VTLRSPKALVCCVLLLACSCTHRGPAACSAPGELQLVTHGRLTAGVDLSNPPFGFSDPAGKAAGFEVEMLRALAKAMELKLTLLNRSAPALIPAVLAHRLDVAAASFQDDGGLPNDVCTSGSYLDADVGVVVTDANAQTLKTVDALAGRSVVVVGDGTAARWAASHLGGSRLVRMSTTDDALSQVRTGAVDAAVIDRPLAVTATRDYPQLRLVAGVKLGAHYVLAGAPDTAVISPVDTAIQTLSDDGTLDALKKKWFGPGL
jgi:ABC-type amino acid transport substrate-binding protein